VETEAWPPVAVPLPPLPPVALPDVVDTPALAWAPVEALPPAPAVADALPPPAEPPTPTFTAGTGNEAGTAAGTATVGTEGP